MGLLRNFGAILFAAGEKLHAAEQFERLLRVDPDYEWGEVYVAPVAMAFYEKFRADQTSVDLEFLEPLLAWATDVKILPVFKLELGGIVEALQDVRCARIE